jgi:HSP20 family protein
MRDKKPLAPVRASTPLGLLRQMTTELDRMFEDPWTVRWPALQLENKAAWSPRLDVFEKDNRLITKVDLPGVKKEDVSVEVADGQLTLIGERKIESENQNDNFYRAECEYGSFCRSVPLPPGVKVEDIKATFTDGVLEVSMPLPAKNNGRKIPIQEPAPTATAAA